MRKRLIGLLCTVSICTLFLGCHRSVKEGERGELKVLNLSEEEFYRSFGNDFSSKFPNIHLQVIGYEFLLSDPHFIDRLDDYIDQEKPDVVLIPSKLYEKMSAEGKLYPLDSLIKEDRFDLKGISSGLIDWLKMKGDGQLYGLTPVYQTKVLFYNKDLFNRYGVEYPKDQMSWDEVLQLTGRFSASYAEDRVYGLDGRSTTDFFSLADQIGQTQGLTWLDTEHHKIIMNTDSWKAVIQNIITTFRSGALYLQNQSNKGNEPDPFFSGKSAMAIDLEAAVFKLNTPTVNNGKTMNWDVVTGPVDPNNPDIGSDYTTTYVSAILENTPNLKSAWQLVKYINGDEWSKNHAVLPVTEILARPSNMLAHDSNHHVEAFYKLKPNGRMDDMDLSGSNISQDFIVSFRRMFNDQIKAVLENHQSLNDALGAIERSGQEELLKTMQH